MDLKRIFSYLNQYGIRSFASSFYEKRLLDRRRFGKISGEPYDFPCELPCGTLSEQAQPSEQEVCAQHALRQNEVGMHKNPMPEKKRILYLTHHFYPERRGGTERFVFNMAREAQAAGHYPLVMVLDFNKPLGIYTDRLGDIFYRFYEYMGVPCVAFRHKKAPRGLYYKRVDASDDEMRKFAHHIFNERKINFVHAAYPQSFAPLLAEARNSGIPYIVTLTDFAPFCHYANMVRRDGTFCRGSDCGRACTENCPCSLAGDFQKRYSEARDMLFGACGVFVPSEFSRRAYMREFSGLYPVVIPHGIDEKFSFVPREGRARRLLYVGGGTRHKGPALLLSAFAEIERSDIELTVVGAAGVGKTKDKRIKFIGSVPPEDMPRLYKAHDIVVVPSLFYESYNFVTREAAATGALVVCANIGAIGEAVDGSCGILFKAGSKASLIEAINRALDFDLSLLREREMPAVREEFENYAAAMQLKSN